MTIKEFLKHLTKCRKEGQKFIYLSVNRRKIVMKVMDLKGTSSLKASTGIVSAVCHHVNPGQYGPMNDNYAMQHVGLTTKDVCAIMDAAAQLPGYDKDLRKKIIKATKVKK